MVSVDVAIPNYNYGRYLRGCVESVLEQDVDRLRVLIVDNASTDGSAELARQLTSEDDRIEVRLRPLNQGAHASFNEAVNWAKADYFLILCSDDLLAPGALRRAVSVMEEHRDVHMTFGKALHVREVREGNFRSHEAEAGTGSPAILSGRDLIEAFCRDGRNFVSGPTAVVRTETQKKVGHYRPALPHTDDLEVWLRFGCHGGAARIDAVQAIARVHDSNQSATVCDILHWNREFENAFESFFAHEGSALQGAERLLKTVRCRLARRVYGSALRAFVRREPIATDLFRDAFRLDPLLYFIPPFAYLLQNLFASGIGSRLTRA